MILYIGGKSYNWSNVTKDAVLCTNQNIEQLIKENRDVYTSLDDVILSNFCKLIDVANEIIFVENEEITNTQLLFINALLYPHVHSKKIRGATFSEGPSIKLSDRRKSSKCQLWVAGCSISHGCGVDNHQRWGSLVGSALDLSVSFLTYPGSSIEWAADQILRSDIQNGDIVCWGITNPERFLHYTNAGDQQHINSRFFETHKQSMSLNYNMIEDKSLIYKSINYIHQVNNFTKKLGATLVCGIILPPVTESFGELLTGLRDIKKVFFDRDFLAPTDLKFLDLGSDNLHPGPLQHQEYANKFLDKLKESS